MTLRHGRRARRGLTLLEVIVALVIFVGSAAVLSRLVALGLDMAQYSQRDAEALILLETRSAELELGFIEPKTQDFTADPDFPGWEWSIQVENTDLDYLARVTLIAKRVKAGPDRGLEVKLARLYFDEAAAEDALQQSTSSSSSGSSTSTGSGTSSGGASSGGAAS